MQTQSGNTGFRRYEVNANGHVVQYRLLTVDKNKCGLDVPYYTSEERQAAFEKAKLNPDYIEVTAYDEDMEVTVDEWEYNKYLDND